MRKENYIAIGVTLITALLIWYLYPYLAKPQTQSTDSRLKTPSSINYQQASRALDNQINLISPTPPTGPKWFVDRIDFVDNKNLAYVTYQDTHNFFRLLIEVKLQDSQYRFIPIASFEPAYSTDTDKIVWEQTHGENLTENSTTTTFIYDQELNQWKEK